MPPRTTALTAAAGEHFVAYKLSGMGYPVALTRGGSPTVDLMVGDLHGNAAVSIQVKTSSGAWRWRKRNPENSLWEWDVGKKAMDIRGKSILYTFVDLKWDDELPPLPDVFVVPSHVVADFLRPDFSRFMFWIYEGDKSKYFERWDLITQLLESPAAIEASRRNA